MRDSREGDLNLCQLQKVAEIDVSGVAQSFINLNPFHATYIRGFLMFSGLIKRDQWHEMGYSSNIAYVTLHYLLYDINNFSMVPILGIIHLLRSQNFRKN